MKALHDYIADRVVYDYDSLEPGARAPQDAVTVFERRLGVCAGYANLLAAVCDGALGGAVLNVGAGRRTSVNELARILGTHVGAQGVEPVYEPERAGEVMHSVADISAIRDRLGYEVVEEMDAGLGSTADWFLERFAAGGSA